MNGDFIVDRKIETVLADIARERSIWHKVFSAGWVHTFTKDGKRAQLIGYKWSLNDSAASGIASDKVAAFEVLQSEGVAAVPHTLLRTKVDFVPHWPNTIPDEFVLKPLNGTSGHGVYLCMGKEDAAAIISQRKIAAWAISPKLTIAREVRVVVLDGDVLLSYEKHPLVGDGLVLHNLGKGATAEVISLSDHMRKLAVRASDALGLRLAAVDIVLVDDTWCILEVNDGIMMEYFLRQSDEYFALAKEVYEKIIDRALL